MKKVCVCVLVGFLSAAISLSGQSFGDVPSNNKQFDSVFLHLNPILKPLKGDLRLSKLRRGILPFTERERQQMRLFSVPDMLPLDGGGFPVFEEATGFEHNLPMGIALYKSPKDSAFYAIVGRKTGPSRDYLYQYELRADSTGVNTRLVRKFGQFSGQKEIEAIAVDDAYGYVYYADEGVCIRKYYAEPDMGNEEVSCFGGRYFLEDIEGITIATYPNGDGYLIVSNQQLGEFNIFSRKENTFVKAVNLSTYGTDGCEVVTTPLNDTFKNGLFVAMNEDKDFYFFDLGKVIAQ